MFGSRSHLSLFLPPSHVIGCHLIILPSHPIHAVVARVCHLQRLQIYNFNTLIRWTKDLNYLNCISHNYLSSWGWCWCCSCNSSSWSSLSTGPSFVVVVTWQHRLLSLAVVRWFGDEARTWKNNNLVSKTNKWAKKKKFYLLRCKPKLFFRHIVNIVNGDGRR